jgi:hypothetical protein
VAAGGRRLRLRRPGAQARRGRPRAGRARIGLKPGRGRREPRFLPRAAIVFALALAIRVVYLGQITGTPLTDVLLIDSDTYDRFGRAILAGTFGGENVYAVNVLYPWFVALVYAIGKGSLSFALQAQALLDASTCVLAAWIAARHFGTWTGLVCGVLLALCGPLVFYAGALLTPTLVTFLVTLALAALTAWQGSGRGRWAALGGLAVGLATLARGNNVLLVLLALPGFLLLAKGGRGAAWKAWGTFAALALAPALLATLRNYAVAGHPVPIAANGGVLDRLQPAGQRLYVLPPLAKSGEYAHEVGPQRGDRAPGGPSDDARRDRALAVRSGDGMGVGASLCRGAPARDQVSLFLERDRAADEPELPLRARVVAAAGVPADRLRRARAARARGRVVERCKGARVHLRVDRLRAPDRAPVLCLGRIPAAGRAGALCAGRVRAGRDRAAVAGKVHRAPLETAMRCRCRLVFWRVPRRS